MVDEVYQTLRRSMARRNGLHRRLGRGLRCLFRFVCRLQTRLNLINQAQIADHLHAPGVNLMSFAVCHVGEVRGIQIRNRRSAPMYPECLGKHDYRDQRRGPSVAARMADAKFGGSATGSSRAKRRSSPPTFAIIEAHPAHDATCASTCARVEAASVPSRYSVSCASVSSQLQL